MIAEVIMNKLRYSTPSKYYSSPWLGIKCNKKIEKHPSKLKVKKQDPSEVAFQWI